MATMKAVRVPEAGADLELVELPVPDPGRDEVRIKVEACGICHSDVFVTSGAFPGIEYPRVPGHEIVGVVDAIGTDVDEWVEGQRVGVGWHGGHCFSCRPCRHGDFIQCENEKITGITHDGGYAEYVVVPSESVAHVPQDFAPTDAAPLLCAGITVYNALRNSGARPGDVVAVQGIGGLGHLAVQYARKMGFFTIALSGSPSKESLARELGAHAFLAASEGEPAEALQQMGGARVVLGTAPSSGAMSRVIDGLGTNGELIVVAATDTPIEVTPLQLIMKRRVVRGWPSGVASDSEDTLQFSALTGIRPTVETFPLEDAAEALQKVLENEVRFRAVLIP